MVVEGSGCVVPSRQTLPIQQSPPTRCLLGILSFPARVDRPAAKLAAVGDSSCGGLQLLIWWWWAGRINVLSPA